jgi:hypothetical protein
MPLWHCNSCHHEWEGTEDRNVCDWCHDDGYIIEKVTQFERFVNWLFDKKIVRTRLVKRGTKPPA